MTSKLTNFLFFLILFQIISQIVLLLENYLNILSFLFKKILKIYPSLRISSFKFLEKLYILKSITHQTNKMNYLKLPTILNTPLMLFIKHKINIQFTHVYLKNGLLILTIIMNKRTK